MKKRDILLSAVSGILLIFSFPNLDFGFFAWFALVPLLYAIEGKNLLGALVLGLITGFISFLGILYWIIVAVHTYGNVPLILSGLILLLLIAYLSLFVGTFTSRSILDFKSSSFAPFSGLAWNTSVHSSSLGSRGPFWVTPNI